MFVDLKPRLDVVGKFQMLHLRNMMTRKMIDLELGGKHQNGLKLRKARKIYETNFSVRGEMGPRPGSESENLPKSIDIFRQSQGRWWQR